MEPFSIHCDTCAAKLKVTRASAIGQKLACPKCGSMILVVAPEDWVAPPDDSSIQNQTSDSSESDFEDIDHILEQKSRPAAKTKSNPVRRQSSTKVAPQKTATNVKTAPEAAPMLPNENWTSADSQQRRNLVLISSGIIGLLIIVGAIGLAVNSNRKPNADPVAENVKDSESSDMSSDAEDHVTDSDDNSDDSNENQSQDDIDAETAPDKTAEKDIETQESSQNPGTESANVDSASNGNDENDDPLGLTKNSDNEDDTQDNDSPKPNIPSPFRSDLDDILQTSTVSVDDVKTNFDELAEALDSKGTSLFELNQLAILDSNPKRIGLPKYFIRRPAKMDSSDFQNLSDPVLGIKLNDYTFLELIAEISQISGVPIAFDTNHSFYNEFDFGFRVVDFEKTNSDFKRILEAALQTVDNRLKIDLSGSSSARIIINGQSANVERQLTLPDSYDKPPEQFVEMLKQLVVPGSWTDDKFVKLSTDKIEIRHKSAIVDLASELLRKWSLAKEVCNGKTDVSVLANRWTTSEECRMTKLDGIKHIDEPILEFFAGIQKSSGVNILVDFSSLSEDDWNPKTIIPWSVSEPNIGALVNEISHSMNVTYRAVNSNTLEITTKSRLKEMLEVEFYFCKDILSGNLNKHQLTEIVRQSLQSANRLAECRVYFDEEIQSFIVVGDQNIQRLIGSVLNRLRDLP